MKSTSLVEDLTTNVSLTKYLYGFKSELYLQAFLIIASNVLRVAAINSVGDFVLFLGKVGVMAATAAIGIVWFKVKDILPFIAFLLFHT